MAGMLENLVYIEMRRRGYNVFVGKMGNMEVDFVARRQDETVYIQVCESMASDDTRIRELKPLLAIRDNFPKYIIVGNPMYVGNYEGIECMYIGDFLSFY